MKLRIHILLWFQT